MKKNADRSAGFTTIELIVVIVLLGILAAFAVPHFADLDSFRTRAAYDEVAGALRYAQKLAVASGCQVRVVTTLNSYDLQQCSPSVGCTDGTTSFCASSDFVSLSGHPVVGNSDLSVSLTPRTITFDAMGRSSSGTTITVGGSKTISIVAETGYVDAP